jgi:hypothetical protein
MDAGVRPDGTHNRDSATARARMRQARHVTV